MRSGVISHERATFEWSQYDMGILQRASDILSATVNDFVDRLENPEKMLRQALREMETSIARALEATAKTVASERILRAELEGLTAAIQGFEQKAVRALEEGGDDRARHALLERRVVERLAVPLRKDLEAARSATTILSAQVGQLRARHAEAKRQLVLLSARQKAAEAWRHFLIASSGVAWGPFARFDRLREGVEAAEAEAEAFASIEPTGRFLDGAASPITESDEREAEARAVEEELSALRAQWNPKP